MDEVFIKGRIVSPIPIAGLSQHGLGQLIDLAHMRPSFWPNLLLEHVLEWPTPKNQ